ncbi:hypothetical protein TetV_450 [Tetraselmis virus 1]|uniref:Uncharacterized protein n=1 Tax=Tetraselmis virus 1 TaxID=2060617 RepID=A0A2P0VNS1_9VIRU|nr:hypothetical protein QJ968_gp604 [Tetraselmis virus 1]AUF82532.1 hypothetical protein TetV_450 [Tetraselmis virus 1]
MSRLSSTSIALIVLLLAAEPMVSFAQGDKCRGAINCYYNECRVRGFKSPKKDNFKMCFQRCILGLDSPNFKNAIRRCRFDNADKKNKVEKVRQCTRKAVKKHICDKWF